MNLWNQFPRKSSKSAKGRSLGMIHLYRSLSTYRSLSLSPLISLLISLSLSLSLSLRWLEQACVGLKKGSRKVSVISQEDISLSLLDVEIVKMKQGEMAHPPQALQQGMIEIGRERERYRERERG